MLFEKEKYYKYIGTLENMINFSYAIFIIIGFIIGMAGQFIGALMGAGIGFLLAKVYTLNAKIRIQEMKWKMDLYQRIK